MRGYSAYRFPSHSTDTGIGAVAQLRHHTWGGGVMKPAMRSQEHHTSTWHGTVVHSYSSTVPYSIYEASMSLSPPALPRGTILIYIARARPIDSHRVS